MTTFVKALTSAGPMEYVAAVFASLMFAVPFIKVSSTLQGLPMLANPSWSVNPFYHAPITALIFIAIALILLILLFQRQLQK